MAAVAGISLRSVQRIWVAHGLEPHRVRPFKLSKDPAFAAKPRGHGRALSRPAGAQPRLQQRGAFHSLINLQAAINRYLDEHDGQPKPFVWTAGPDRIIEKMMRRHQTIASDH
jgi:hypothetical protein